MNNQDFYTTFCQLLGAREYEKARTLIERVRERASQENDRATLEWTYMSFVQLYSMTEPPDFDKAEYFCLEREKNNDNSYNKLQTAMFYFYVAGQYEQAADKLGETIERARQENNSSVLYTSLALLGQTSIKLGRMEDAAHLILELRRMISSNKRLPIGDETNFLEAAQESGVETSLVRGIAGLLAPRCSDPEFSRRLSKLSE